MGHLSTIEAIVGFLAYFLVLVYLCFRCRNWHVTLVGLALLIPIFLSVERTSQFLVVDELVSLDHAVYGIRFSPIKNSLWAGARARTSTILFSILALVLGKLNPGLSKIQLFMLIKSLHWLIGFFLLVCIFHLSSSLFVQKKHQPYYLVLFFFVGLLSPNNALIAKVFSADLFSTHLGLIALLVTFCAYRANRPFFSMLAVISAFFAAQEKLTASPILLLTIGYFAYLHIRQFKDAGRFLMRLYYVTLGFLLACGISLVQALLLGWIRTRHIEAELTARAIDPLISWYWPVLFASKQVVGSGFDPDRLPGKLLLSIITVGSILLLTYLLEMLHGTDKADLQKATKWLRQANNFLFILLILIGIAGFYLVTAYARPLPGTYAPSHFYDSDRWYIDSQSQLIYFLSVMSLRFARYISVIPSVFFLGFLALRLSKLHQKPTIWSEVLILLTALTPLLVSLINGPLLHLPRYSAILLFGIQLIVLIELISHFDRIKTAYKAVLTTGFVALLLIEVLPFAPLYGGPFRPIWMLPPRQDSVAEGQMLPVWQGWGEETMIASMYLQELPQCRRGCVVYSVWSGDYLNVTSENRVVSIPFWTVDKDTSLTYDANSFFVVNRASLLIGDHTLPGDANPILTLKYRGYAQAWVFAGDDLANANFSFDP